VIDLVLTITNTRAEPAGPQKRPVAGPRKGFMLQNTKLETITPIPYDILKVRCRALCRNECWGQAADAYVHALCVLHVSGTAPRLFVTKGPTVLFDVPQEGLKN
jgi:hypothetical protein